jgi:hypothetical protein
MAASRPWFCSSHRDPIKEATPFLQPRVGRAEVKMGQRMDEGVGQLIRLGAAHIGEEHGAIFERGVALLRQIDDVQRAAGSVPSQRWISGITIVAAVM